MSEYRPVLERVRSSFPDPEMPFEGVLRRRDQRQRRRRIGAGVVGIAVFVAAVWIVTSVGSLDRSQTAVIPGDDVTEPAETAPPRAPASAPDVVSQEMCSDGAGVRLELTDIGDRIKVRVEVHRSPVGHEWRIVLRHAHTKVEPIFHWHHARIFESIRVASESGDLVVQRSVDEHTWDGFRAKAADRQTGQVCEADATMSE